MMTKIAEASGLAFGGAPFDASDAGAGVGVLVLIQLSPVFASIVASLSSNFFLSKEFVGRLRRQGVPNKP